MAKQNNINKVFLLGNLGNEPELRTTQKGNTVAHFSIATSRKQQDAEGNWIENTCWHRITVWGKRAEACIRFLHKGDRVFVEGNLESKNWTDKNGVIRKTTEVIVDDIKFLGTKRREDYSDEKPAEMALAQ